MFIWLGRFEDYLHASSNPHQAIYFFLQGRGERGVFDLEELVDILKGEKVAKSSSWTFLTI